MKLEEALISMREGKSAKRKEWSKNLSIKQIMVWDGNLDRTGIELRETDIMADDWEIVE